VTQRHCIPQEKLLTISILKTNCTEKCNSVNITLIVIEQHKEVHLKKKLSMCVPNFIEIRASAHCVAH